MSEVADNIARIRERMAKAAERSGRSAETVTLVTVTKTVSAARIAEAYAAGARDFGENYMQEAVTKIGQPPLDQPDIRWHFIGHLQSNKAKEVVGRFSLVHSVDSLSLAKEIGKRALKVNRTADILLEARLDTGAEAKFGFPLETLLEASNEAAALEGVRLCGLMGMPPFSDEPEQSRPYFRQLRALFEQLPETARRTLSMGMSGDFEIAIEEGATLVRIGTAIFGRRA